jgi:hypothetical protein
MVAKRIFCKKPNRENLNDAIFRLPLNLVFALRKEGGGW